VQRRLLLNVVVLKRAAILQLLSSKDESLLVWWDPLFILDLRLDGLDGISALYLQRDGLPRQSFDEDLHRDSHFAHQRLNASKTNPLCAPADPLDAALGTEIPAAMKREKLDVHANALAPGLSELFFHPA